MMFSRRGRDESTGFGGSLTEMDTTEAYVQQLISQGYPEDTARTYAEQYAAQAAQQQAAAAPAAAAPAAAAANPRVEAYVQQLMSQGYPEATARAHAEQYKDRL